MEEPPVITIRNPASDAPLSDVIGSGTERLVSPRQKRLVWLVATAVALVAVGTWGIGQLADQRRQDRAALREVSLDLIGNDFDAPHTADLAQLTLMSHGRRPLTVLSATLDLPGLPALEARPVKLRHDVPTVVDFRVPTRCTATGLPTRIDVRVRTSRGSTTTVRLNPGTGLGGFTTAFVYAATAGCGRAPADSFDVSTTTSRFNEALRLSLTVHNRSGAPRGLGARDTGALDDFTDDVIAGGTGPVLLDPGATRTFRLDLFVEDCGTAVPDWSGTGAGGITAPVIGTDEKVVLVPFGDPVVSRWVKDICALRDTTQVPITVTGSGFGGQPTVTVTP